MWWLIISNIIKHTLCITDVIYDDPAVVGQRMGGDSARD